MSRRDKHILIWAIIIALALISLLNSCEKVDYNPTGIDKFTLGKLNNIKRNYIESNPLIAVISVDAYHFQAPGDNPVNSPKVYLFEDGLWNDMTHPSMNDRFNVIKYKITNADTTWVKFQYPSDPDYGKMRFCVSTDEFEGGGCYFMQPCAVYEFEWSANALSLTDPQKLTVVYHDVRTRVYPSDTTPNDLCP